MKIKTLGTCKIESPFKDSLAIDDDKIKYIEDEKIVFSPLLQNIDLHSATDNIPAAELAGPRKLIYFDPSKTRCAIVTCGGLCPGLNDVIRGIVMNLYYHYNVKHIYGVQFGYRHAQR